jgi:hypothetical protein
VSLTYSAAILVHAAVAVLRGSDAVIVAAPAPPSSGIIGRL